MPNLYKNLMLLVGLIAATGSFQICSGESNTTIEGSIASPIFNLKGTYQVISDKYKHLSLLNGAIAWETGYIEKLLTIDVEREKNDPTAIIKGSAEAQLCNYLFTCYPSPAKDIPSVIGIRKLFVGDDQTIDDRAAKFIVERVAKALHEINAKSEVEEGSKEKKGDDRLIKSEGPPAGSELELMSHCPRGLGQTQEQNKTLAAQIDELIDEIIEKNYSENPTLMPHTAEMILLAFVYRALGHHKGYIKYFYEKLNDLLDNKFLFHPRARSIFTHYPNVVYENLVSGVSKWRLVGKSISRLPYGWEHERYDTVTPKAAKQKIEDLLSQAPKNDYQRLAQGLSSLIYDQKGKDCSLFAEDLVFYASQLSYLPKPLGPAWVTYKLPAWARKANTDNLSDETNNENSETGVNPNLSFFDTTGTAIRNFIRFISYDYTQQEFSLKKLKQQIHGINPSDFLIRYLKNYGPRDDDTPEAYNEWAKLMVNKNNILYQGAFKREKQGSTEAPSYKWVKVVESGNFFMNFKTTEVMQLFQKRFDDNFEFRDAVNISVSEDLVDKLIILAPAFTNIEFMLYFLLKTKKTEDVFGCPLTVKSLDDQQTISADSYQEIGKNHISVLTYGTLDRVMKTYLFFAPKRKKCTFRFVTTPYFGAFGFEDFDIFSPTPAVDHEDIDYKKTPELSLLITRLKLIELHKRVKDNEIEGVAAREEEEAKGVKGLPPKLVAANQLLVPVKAEEPKEKEEKKETEPRANQHKQKIVLTQKTMTTAQINRPETPEGGKADEKELLKKLNNATSSSRDPNQKMNKVDLALAQEALASQNEEIKRVGLDLYAQCVLIGGIGFEEAKKAAQSIFQDKNATEDLKQWALGIAQALIDKKKDIDEWKQSNYVKVNQKRGKVIVTLVDQTVQSKKKSAKKKKNTGSGVKIKPQTTQLTEEVNEPLEQENREPFEENAPKGEEKVEHVSTGTIPQEITPSTVTAQINKQETTETGEAEEALAQKPLLSLQEKTEKQLQEIRRKRRESTTTTEETVSIPREQKILSKESVTKEISQNQGIVPQKQVLSFEEKRKKQLEEIRRNKQKSATNTELNEEENK